MQIDNVSQQQYASAAFSGFNRARFFFISYKLISIYYTLFCRSPTRTDTIITNNSVSNRLRRTLASRSMSAEVFHSSHDTVHSTSIWKNE